MSKNFLVPALVAAMLGSSMSVMAQDRDYQHDRDNNWQQQRDDRYQRNDDRYQRNDDRYQRNDDRYQRNDDRYQRNGDRYQRDERRERDRFRRERAQQGGWGRTADFNSGYDGYGPDHDMHRGQRLPSRYRTHQYVVDHWRAHHLSRPPRGQHWVQVGADYVLVAAATGLIVQAVTGN
jgi:Ni/Co efflux regulator RcnB